ncbi:MAG: nicotinate (nicotinamide) nucleotide adenylyltransferase [Anaerolineae bacterium]|nr:nicotinate (nicotinamide) nucleotide adenylyltransferase [Anaerolineae bacterium]
MAGLSGKRKRLGIFGGTFDPPHVGHLILAMEAYDQLHLDRVLWVLEPNPPHKAGKKLTPIDIRIEMVLAAIDEDEKFELSRVDIDRPGPHFVVDTMRLLRQQYPEEDLVFLMGGDSLRNLPTWLEPESFIQACDRLGVMRRPGEVINMRDIEERLPGISQKIEFIDAPLLEISSNQIRSLVSQKKPYRYYLPIDVFQIIKAENLYQDESD